MRPDRSVGGVIRRARGACFPCASDRRLGTLPRVSTAISIAPTITAEIVFMLIDAYLDRIGPLDKAGSYSAQEDNGELIDRFGIIRWLNPAVQVVRLPRGRPFDPADRCGAPPCGRDREEPGARRVAPAGRAHSARLVGRGSQPLPR